MVLIRSSEQNPQQRWVAYYTRRHLKLSIGDLIMKKLNVLLFSAIAAGQVWAAPSATNTPQTEIGVTLGAFNHYNLNCNGATQCDRNASAGGKLFLDTRLTPWLGVGVAAYSVGAASANFQTAKGNMAGSGRSSGLALTAFIPLDVDNFTFKARLGAGYSKGKVSYSNGTSESKNSLVPVMGLGVSYAITKNWAANLDWDLLPTKFSNQNKSNVDMVSLGLSYRF